MKESKKSEGRGLYFFLEMLDVLVGNHPIFVSKKQMANAQRSRRQGLTTSSLSCSPDRIGMIGYS